MNIRQIGATIKTVPNFPFVDIELKFISSTDYLDQIPTNSVATNKPFLLAFHLMPFFNFDLRKYLLFGAVLLFPLFILTLTDPNQKEPWIFVPFTRSATFVSSLYSSAVISLQTTTKTYLNLVGIRRQIVDLELQNQELRAQKLEMESLRAENDRLRSALEFKRSLNRQLIPAEITANDLLYPGYISLMIDKGSEDGIEEGFAVISEHGVVGYVLEAGVGSSQVLLVNDRYAVVDAVVQRTQARGLVEGMDKNRLQLRYLERKEDVDVGDLIVTSGLDPYFPAGFPVGRVISVEKEPFGVTIDVVAAPIVEPQKLRTVFVVKRLGETP